MTKLGAWNLRFEFESYCEAVTAFRNLRWWTKQKRNEFVMEANRVARGPSLSIGSSDKRRSSSKWHHETEGSETDADELGHTLPISKDKRLETL